MKKLLILVSACCLLTACKNPVVNIFTAAAVEVAACRIAQNNPEVAPWLTRSAEVFKTFSLNEPPTPNQLEEALLASGAPGYTYAELQLLWSGTVLAYTAIWSIDMTPERQQEIRVTMAAISWALENGARCAPPVKASSALKPTHPVYLPPLAEEIKKLF